MTDPLRGKIARPVIEQHLTDASFAPIIGDGDLVATAACTTPPLLESDTTISFGMETKLLVAGWYDDHLELVLRGSTGSRKRPGSIAIPRTARTQTGQTSVGQGQR